MLSIPPGEPKYLLTKTDHRTPLMTIGLAVLKTRCVSGARPEQGEKTEALEGQRLMGRGLGGVGWQRHAAVGPEHTHFLPGIGVSFTPRRLEPTGGIRRPKPTWARGLRSPGPGWLRSGRPSLGPHRTPEDEGSPTMVAVGLVCLGIHTLEVHSLEG